jgi:hypothetical protein
MKLHSILTSVYFFAVDFFDIVAKGAGASVKMYVHVMKLDSSEKNTNLFRRCRIVNADPFLRLAIPA